MTPIKINLSKSETPRLIVGLGNIGKAYQNTRHNAGFIFIDAINSELDYKGVHPEYNEHNEYELWTYKSLNLALMKPKTLMNLSGKAVKEYYRYHSNYSSRNLIVAHDDLDIMLGDFKINEGKGPKMHNGLLSLERELASSSFIRVRLGIENRKGLPISGLDYVLYKFSPEELITFKETIAQILSTRCTF